MSEHYSLQALIDLIEFDRVIIKKGQIVAQIKKLVAQLDQAVEKLAKERASFEGKVRDAQKVVHDQELEMKTLDAKEQEKKKILETVDSQRVYDSLKKEIGFLKKSQYDHEKKLVQSWKELDSAQKVLADHVGSIDEKTTQLAIEITVKRTELDVLERELHELSTVRLEKERGVSPEWLEKYNIMRSQTNDPIVRVEQNSCSGCFAQLTPQALLDLDKKKLTQCASCYRFLYKPDETE